MKRSAAIDETRRFIVEGGDDRHVIDQLVGVKQVKKPEIHPKSGFSELLKSLPENLTNNSLEFLAVVFDADRDPVARWREVREKMTAAGVEDVPEAPAEGGFIGNSPSDRILPRRTGIWMMPNNRSPGALEELVVRMIPVVSPLFAHVRASIDSIPPNERLFSDEKRTKAEIRTWLAWQKDPGLAYGSAIRENYLDTETPGIADFVAWLNKLYS